MDHFEQIIMPSGHTGAGLFAFYPEDPSSNSADINLHFFCKITRVN